MRRSWLIILSGIVAALAAYFALYHAATANVRHLRESPEPELAWLKTEFHLSDPDYARVCRMHEHYLAGCAERCRLIDEKNAHLRYLLAATNVLTPEIERTLLEAAQLRAECQKEMLEEFYAVSRTMPPAEGKRYLEWMQGQTVLSDSHRGMQAAAGSPDHGERHH